LGQECDAHTSSLFQVCRAVAGNAQLSSNRYKLKLNRLLIGAHGGAPACASPALGEAFGVARREDDMANESDDELLAAAKRLLAETKTEFDGLLHGESGYPRADAALDAFERTIREAARKMNEWLSAYDSAVGDDEVLEEIHRRELDRRQPES
jgi:hypothetical protein